jgi:hypothetical protein
VGIDDDGQKYSRRNLLVYLAIMDRKASPVEAIDMVRALAARGRISQEHLEEEITWTQFDQEKDELLKVLPLPDGRRPS